MARVWREGCGRPFPELPLSPPDDGSDRYEAAQEEASEKVRAKYRFGRGLWPRIEWKFEAEIEREVEAMEEDSRCGDEPDGDDRHMDHGECEIRDSRY